MSECPKCGSTNIMGPFYQRADHWNGGHEGLLYRCARCGFEMMTPTLDVIRRNGATAHEPTSAA